MSRLDLWILWCHNGAMTDRTFDTTIRVRVTQEQDELIRKAADHAAERRGTGTLSDWLRETLITAAREELG